MKAWEAGEQPQIQEYLKRLPVDAQELALRQLIAVDVEMRRERGEEVGREEYESRFPRKKEIVDAAFDLAGSGSSSKLFDSTVSIQQANVESDGTAKPGRVSVPNEELSAEIGPFRIIRELGRGAFGVVYQAHDSALDRPVALKVPCTEQIGSEADLATLDLGLGFSDRLMRRRTPIAPSFTVALHADSRGRQSSGLLPHV